jgi:hypothetical protein
MSLPVFVENSKVPVWLSKISPIEIGAISLGVFVFSRGTISETTRRHETIHYHQWRELAFLLFPILYGLFWLVGFARYRDGVKAYYAIPFEREAYVNDDNPDYLEKRPFWAWRKYL